MNARTLKITSALGLFLIAAACGGNSSAGSGDGPKGAATSAPPNAPAVRAAIDSADHGFETAFRAGDAAMAASFYAQDAVSMPPNAEPESGRAAIEKGYGELFKTLG